MAKTSCLVISLDFELNWGIRDQRTLESYRDHLLGVRSVVPQLLALFRSYGVHATWATVGFLLCESRDELYAFLPSRLPKYRDARRSPYPGLQSLGQNEAEDPFHYAPSLVKQVVETPGQELASHTFSHFYCLEPGPTPADFRSDLEAACALTRHKFGQTPKSLVFPRNQHSPEALEVVRSLGFRAYRGQPDAWLFRPRAETGESRRRRAVRLLDHYAPLSGSNRVRRLEEAQAGLVNVPASRFLRPYSTWLRSLERVRFDRIKRGLIHTARRGGMYHLWWHPHNFGRHPRENLGFLRALLDVFSRLREGYGMQSLSMGEVSDQAI